jgi:hypothetical protein
MRPVPYVIQTARLPKSIGEAVRQALAAQDGGAQAQGTAQR